MAESIHEQAMVAIKATVEAITADSGATYWYKPDVVERAATVEDMRLLNDRFDTIYILAPDEEVPPEVPGKEVDERYTFDFLLARKHLNSDEPYSQDAPIRWTIQTRLSRDFKKALWADITLGGIVDNVNITRVSFRSEETHVEKWAVVIGQAEIVSLHSAATP